MNHTGNEYAGLIYSMIQETRELELEIVSLRYLLSTCMDENHRRNLRSEIYAGTDPEFRDDPAYKKYIQEYLDGRDPFETRSYARRLRKQAHGHIEEYRQYHPNICLAGLLDHLKVKEKHILDL